MAPASPAGSGSGGSSITLRIYDPRTLDNEFYLDEKKHEIEVVLAKVEGIYSQVKLDKEQAIGNCFCFGLLDPATNILVNSVISKAKSPATAAAPPPDNGRGRKRRWRPDRDMNQRSLDGLVAFLTCLFPYLPDAEARWYLYAAELDPLAAALLVVDSRGMRRFGLCSGTTAAAVETALRCAAVAAKHPDPSRLVLAWKKLVSHDGLEKFASEISSSNKPDDDNVARHVLSMVKFTGASSDDTTNLRLEKPWELAEKRLHDNPIAKELLFPVRGAMKSMLLATIHGFYLQALARLPTAELRSRYHRSVLEGGYSYGPLDPVSNIIVNTVWYDHCFPASKQVTLEMISTQCLWRVAARSLYGLVSFLCTRYANLSPDQALQRLMVAGANLQVADPNLFDDMPVRDSNKLRCSSDGMQTGHGSHGTCEMQQDEAFEAGNPPSVSVLEAYDAAATAAFHFNPLAQKEFLGSPDVVSKLRAAAEALHLQDGHSLSCQDLESLSMSLLKCSSSTSKSCQQEGI